MTKDTKKRILIGIGGGTGSGKTSVAKNIVHEIGRNEVVIIEMDSYYHDLSNIPMDVRNHHNFDHPDAYDFLLLIEQMGKLLQGNTVHVPVYDYKTHTRTNRTTRISGHLIIVLEGILALYHPQLREMMDIKVFIDTPDDIRFIRRLKRDIRERARTVDSVIQQYMETVRPMHLQFVERTRQYADIIIPEGGHNKVAIDLLRTKVLSLLSTGEITS